MKVTTTKSYNGNTLYVLGSRAEANKFANYLFSNDPSEAIVNARIGLDFPAIEVVPNIWKK